MQIQFFSQSGDTSMLERLQNAFRECSRISIAVAYLSGDGLKKIQSFIEDNKSLRILCGIHGSISDLPALNDVVTNHSQTEGHVYIGPELFHPKLYICENNAEVIAFVGSANLTMGGLIKNEEILVRIRGASTDSAIKSMMSYFDNLWETCSAPVDYYLSHHPEYSVKKPMYDLSQQQTKILEEFQSIVASDSHILTFRKNVKNEVYYNGKVTIPKKYDQTLNSLEYCPLHSSRGINLILPNGYKIGANFYQSTNNTTSYYQFYILKRRDKAKWKDQITLDSVLQFQFNLVNHNVRVSLV